MTAAVPEGELVQVGQLRNHIGALSFKERVWSQDFRDDDVVFRDRVTGKLYLVLSHGHSKGPQEQLEEAIAQRDADRQAMLQEKLLRQELDSRCARIMLTYGDMERFFGLPDNVDGVGFYVDVQRNCIYFQVRSSEFNRVHPGSETPILEGSWNRKVTRVVQEDAEPGQWINNGVDRPYQEYVRFEWNPGDTNG